MLPAASATGVRTWLMPLNWLMPCRQLFSTKRPPTEFATLTGNLIQAAGGRINLYIRLQQSNGN